MTSMVPSSPTHYDSMLLFLMGSWTGPSQEPKGGKQLSTISGLGDGNGDPSAPTMLLSHLTEWDLQEFSQTCFRY